MIKPVDLEKYRRMQNKAKRERKRKRKSEPRDDGNDSDLIDLNKRYAVVRIGGKTRVVYFDESPTYPGCRTPVFATLSDFTAFMAKHKKRVVGPDGQQREVGLGRWWLAHSERRQYEAVVYAPGHEDPAALNLWTGFACEPKVGDCTLFVQHIRDNICAGDESHFAYLWRWMARAVQQPGSAGEIAVILRGKEGTGKGVFAREFGRLFGAHFRHVVHATHLTGHFNAHLQHCSLLYADEAFFAGDRGHESVLKALVTEETITIEPKGLDTFQVRNCIHLLMSSNSAWVIPAGADARRYFMLDVADRQMQRTEYFEPIIKQMDGGGREALLHELLRCDLSDFNVRAVPLTEALAEQKAYSRRGIDLLVEIIAHNGVLPNVHDLYPNRAVTSGEEKSRGFYASARTLVPDLKFRGSRMIAYELAEHWRCTTWRSHGRNGIEFPPLVELRELFDRKHGRQCWPEGDAWASPSVPHDDVAADNDLEVHL